MAAGDRTKQIYGKVELTLGTVDEKALATVHQKISKDLILDTMGEFAGKLAEDSLCIEKSATLSVVSGVVAEPTGFYRGRLIVMPSGYSYQLRELSPTDFDKLDRPYSYAPQTPMFYKRWAGSLTLWPSVTASYTFLYWGLPTTTPTSALDPETPALYDKAIEYGTIAELAPLLGRFDLATFYLQRFEKEKKSADDSWRRTKTVPLVIQGRDF